MHCPSVLSPCILCTLFSHIIVIRIAAPHQHLPPFIVASFTTVRYREHSIELPSGTVHESRKDRTRRAHGPQKQRILWTVFPASHNRPCASQSFIIYAAASFCCLNIISTFTLYTIIFPFAKSSSRRHFTSSCGEANYSTIFCRKLPISYWGLRGTRV